VHRNASSDQAAVSPDALPPPPLHFLPHHLPDQEARQEAKAGRGNTITRSISVIHMPSPSHPPPQNLIGYAFLQVYAPDLENGRTVNRILGNQSYDLPVALQLPPNYLSQDAGIKVRWIYQTASLSFSLSITVLHYGTGICTYQ
jgi:hypothetical protein